MSPGAASFAPLLFAGRLEEAVETACSLSLDCLELSVSAALAALKSGVVTPLGSSSVESKSG